MTSSYTPPPVMPPPPLPEPRKPVSPEAYKRGCGGCFAVFVLGGVLAGMSAGLPLLSRSLLSVLFFVSLLYLVVSPLRRAINRRLTFENYQGAGFIVFGGTLLFSLMLLGGSADDGKRHPSSTEGSTATESTQRFRPVERESGMSVTADQLVAEYSSNEVAADRKYKGETVTVRGIVESVTKDIVGTPNILLKTDGFRGVACEFRNSDESKLAEVQQGSYVAVRCKCDGLLGNINLSRCEFVAD